MNGKKNGFTLVEVIVILVILAILAAIMIPAMTKWIDKAKRGNAVVEARECLLAGETLAVERYAAGKSYSLATDKDETKALAEVPDKTDILTFNFDAAANPTYLHVLASNGMNVVWQNGAFSVSESGMSNKAALNAIYKTMGEQNYKVQDAFYTPNDSALAAALTAAGVNPAALGATTWAVRYNGAGNYPKLYWTEQDLAGKTKAWVMAYSFENRTQGGHYTVWSAKVVNGVIMGETAMQSADDASQQTYELAHKLYLDKVATGDPK